MMAGRTRTRPTRAKMTFAVTPTLPTVPRMLLMLTALTPENGVTTALSWLTVSSSLMVQSQLASQAVTELGRQYPWVPPPFSIGAGTSGKVATPMPVAISCRALGMLWIGNA